MQRMPRFLVSLFLGTSLIAPLGIQAIDKDHDHDKKERRYYDRERRDYHLWNANEEAAYRHWLMEERREREYRDYSRLNRERQAAYLEMAARTPGLALTILLSRQRCVVR